MQRGTIFQNKWAGFETYFIYMNHPVRTGAREAPATAGYQITKLNGKWVLDKAQYYYQSLRDEEHFPQVGHIDLEEAKEVFIKAILDAIGKKEE